MCTGRHIARSTLTIAVARLLWAFNIESKDGQRAVASEIESFTSGLVGAPKHCEAVFEVRNDQHRNVVGQAFDHVEKDP